MPAPFEPGHTYNRRQDIHDRFGGQRQGGILTPSAHLLIFLFTGDTGTTYGYRDEFRERAVRAARVHRGDDGYKRPSGGREAMAEVVTFKDTDDQCFSQLKLERGERILISIVTRPHAGVKVFQMRLGGFVPGKTLWEYDAVMAGGTMAYAENMVRMYPAGTDHSGSVLRSMVEALMPCPGIEEIRQVLLTRQQRISVGEFQKSCRATAIQWRRVNELLLEQASSEHKPAIQRIIQRCDEVIAGAVFSEEELELISNSLGQLEAPD